MCPGDVKNISEHKKNRTPDAERKWRKRHGLPPARKQGQRGQGKTVRTDRQEACRLVAEALVHEPLAPARRLAELAFDLDGKDEKAQKKARERTRRALADLARKTWLAGDLSDQVRWALTQREAAAEKARQEQERRKAEQEARRREREERFRQQPARTLLRRLLKYDEVREIIAKIVRVKRKFYDAKNSDDFRESWYSFPVSADFYLEKVKIPHFSANFSTKTEGYVLTSYEATIRSNYELAITRSFASLLTIQVNDAKAILDSVKELRKIRRKKEIRAVEAQAEQKLHMIIKNALNRAGWCDPELPAAQILESLSSRAMREAATTKEAGLWPLPAGAVNISTPPGEDWPPAWDREPLDAPEHANCDEFELVDDDGVDPEVAEVFAANAVSLAGGRRRGKGGAKTSFAQRAAAQEELCLVT